MCVDNKHVTGLSNSKSKQNDEEEVNDRLALYSGHKTAKTFSRPLTPEARRVEDNIQELSELQLGILCYKWLRISKKCHASRRAKRFSSSMTPNPKTAKGTNKEKHTWNFQINTNTCLRSALVIVHYDEMTKHRFHSE